MSRKEGNEWPRPFIITIDTEGDELWSQPKTVTTKNIAYLPRFQTLCEKFGFTPCYLTTWEVVTDPEFKSFAMPLVKDSRAEVGTHPHAWSTPPILPLTDDDDRRQPFMSEYSENLIHDKLSTLTDRLESDFEVKMTSHRAGRWGMDHRTARILDSLGYLVDCSVTPNFTFQDVSGGMARGPDYRRYNAFPYFMDLDDFARSGNSKLLQVPMTVLPQNNLLARILFRGGSLSRRIAAKLDPTFRWLRPRGNNLGEMLRIVEYTEEHSYQHLEFMLHSSEFMPGGSPNFSDAESIERLYMDLETLFKRISQKWRGETLTGYYHSLTSQNEVAV